MVMTKREQKHTKIIALFEAGFPKTEISAKLQVPYSTVKRVVSRYLERGTTIRKPGSGRPKLLSVEDSSFILEKIEENPKLSTSRLATILHEEKSVTVSKDTVREVLIGANLKCCVAAVKPLLSKAHLAQRLAFVEDWLMRPMRYFKTIIFSDEVRFKLFQSDGKVLVWRREGERYKMKNCSPSVKFGGGSIMIWGCMGYNGVGMMRIVDETMDRYSYVNILSTSLIESAEILGGSENFIFQQDNATCHTAEFTMKFFERNNINLIDWPAQSPDLNPIENLWSYMDQQLKKKVIKNKTELIAEITRIWNEIPIELVHRLYYSLPNRAKLVCKNKGGHIRY